MTRSTDRSQDPSPFAWIFGGALAMLAAGSVVRALRGRQDKSGTGTLAESPSRTPGAASSTPSAVPSSRSTDAGGDDAELAGHPS